MEKIKQFFTQNDKFAEYVGIELLEASKGKAKAKMEIKNHHLNGVKTVHGAAIFTLADLVFAVASNSHGTIAMGINVSISYLKAVTKGVLFAEAKEVSINPKLATYTIHVTDSGNDLVATFQGMVYRKKEAICV
ncbi:MAG: PaaI family thioesterase [Pseudomonadota bacterium]|uniref:PaaI family thioesterase n=1 Tax=Candidatus Desulfatibia profunda TaxID=2841695 RepID=A0A8J6NQ65_9BACT|nr:PaaI family thioesterase [Candidatus Desulfatibia profunda]MBL7179098.1 PaaI family thioesterase [Desulfobacterales bacterium]